MIFSNELRALVKTTIGSLAEIFNPSIKRDLDEGVTNGKNIFLKRMAFYARMKRAIKSNDPEYINRISQQWWTGDIAEHFFLKYSDRTNRFEDLFLRHFSWSVKGVLTLEERFGYRTLVEFGCGDGSVLRYLSQNAHGIESFVGVDINDIIIEKNKLTADERCTYTCSRIQDFFNTGSIDPFIAFTFGGVLEYLSPDDLRQLYANLMNHGCSITLVEPLNSDPSSSKKGGSAFIGSEVVYFDHDHAAYLGNAGFEVIEEKIVHLMSFRWLYVVACPKGARKTE